MSETFFYIFNMYKNNRVQTFKSNIVYIILLQSNVHVSLLHLGNFEYVMYTHVCYFSSKCTNKQPFGRTFYSKSNLNSKQPLDAFVCLPKYLTFIHNVR